MSGVQSQPASEEPRFGMPAWRSIAPLWRRIPRAWSTARAYSSIARVLCAAIRICRSGSRPRSSSVWDEIWRAPPSCELPCQLPGPTLSHISGAARLHAARLGLDLCRRADRAGTSCLRTARERLACSNWWKKPLNLGTLAGVRKATSNGSPIEFFLHTAEPHVDALCEADLDELEEAFARFGEREDVALFYGSTERYHALATMAFEEHFT